MPEIQNNSEALRQFSGDLYARQQDIYESYNALNAELQTLMDSGWQDAQAERFGELMSYFFENFVMKFLQETEPIPEQLNNLANQIDESYNQVF